MSKLTYASLAGTGVLGASGFGIYHLYSGESISEAKTRDEVAPEVKNLRSKLASEKFTILSDTPENSEHWNTIKDEYNKTKNDPRKSFSPTNQEVTVLDLQALCKDLLEKERDDLYVKVRSWCVIPTTVSNHLINLKLTPLALDDESDKSSWEALSAEYVNSEDKISELIIPHSSGWEKLRSKCKEISGKKNYEDDFDFGLHSSIKWCVKR
ncbi:hypothetical protein MHF_0991 [Mycoplasma haemofelis Ohio2]|uniref:Uncharacterized protein n=1 Tax=Mycoplasma haemofelis (strain Ohio2) TaxID=859194 RepID=F6FJ48_MYCHI|nr:hypothetical protein MHF_0991 [Mycoplasma haemofelis Ohio2]